MKKVGLAVQFFYLHPSSDVLYSMFLPSSLASLDSSFDENSLLELSGFSSYNEEEDVVVVVEEGDQDGWYLNCLSLRFLLAPSHITLGCSFVTIYHRNGLVSRVR